MVSPTVKDFFNEIDMTGFSFTEKYVFNGLGCVFARFLYPFRVTPNQITWFWGGILLLSSIILVFNNWWLNVLAGIGWIVGYALDCTDGSIARSKKIFSKRGVFLDYINHFVTYPSLMFCAGVGVWHTGGCPYFDLLPDYAYLALGVTAGLGISLITFMPTLYRRTYPNHDSLSNSGEVEGSAFKNKKLFGAIMQVNPLTFTNMMALILVFALIDHMWLFVFIYGIGYPLGAMARFVILYRKLPTRDTRD